jgi:hypothetical protein
MRTASGLISAETRTPFDSILWMPKNQFRAAEANRSSEEGYDQLSPKMGAIVENVITQMTRTTVQ